MGEDLDGRADQYSLAATAYHLLTGTPPFRDSNAAVVIGRHLNTEPPALADTRPELGAARSRAGGRVGEGPRRPIRYLQRFRPCAKRTGIRRGPARRRPQRQPRRRRSSDRRRATQPASLRVRFRPAGIQTPAVRPGRCTGTAKGGVLRLLPGAGAASKPRLKVDRAVAWVVVTRRRRYRCRVAVDHRCVGLRVSQNSGPADNRHAQLRSFPTEPTFPTTRSPTTPQPRQHHRPRGARLQPTTSRSTSSATRAVLERDSSSAPAMKAAPAA